MPKYSYKCRHCDTVSTFFHSMSEKKEDCEECDRKETLEKLPSLFTTEHKDLQNQIGDTVKRSIKDLKADLKEQREKLSNEFYSPNK